MVNNIQTSVVHHRIRTFFASLFGIIAVFLILNSVTVIWLNRTLIDTNTFVDTVGPLVTNPPIQNFIANEVSDQLLKSAPLPDLAKTLLPAKDIEPGQTPDQLNSLLRPVIQSAVLQIVQSHDFAVLWLATIRSAHTALVTQLSNSSSDSLSFDLSPAVNGVVAELKTTKLSPMAAKIDLPADAGKINIRSANISRIRNYYNLFQEATLGIIAITLLMIAASILISVHHGKTARRILFGSGILALLQGLLLEAPAVVKLPGNDPVMQSAARAIAMALLHNLQIASFAFGVICILTAIASKLIAVRERKNT